MSPNAKELIDQERLIQTMNYGHLMMVDMVTINASWGNKCLMSEGSRIQNVSMVKNLKKRS
jgi:hypothetical protein